MNLNELIKKYEDKIKKIESILFWSSPENEMISKYEKKICEEILKDLEKLKEKIYGSNDYTLMIHLKKEIIGE